MADAAFKTAPFAGYTTDQLSEAAHAATRNNDTATADKMRREIYRRGRVASGDMTDATPSERLRMIRELKA